MRGCCVIIAASLLLHVTSRTLTATELKRLIPSPSELTGFTISHDAERYTKENLWDYMNGGAPGYLAYGFEEMVTLQVKNLKNNSGIVVDLYDMGNHLNAFGIYAVERIPGGRDLAKYYVKLMSYEMQPETAQSLSHLATLISRKLPKKGEPPHLFSSFPPEGRVKKSERYIKCDVLGQAYFTDGYSVEYDSTTDHHKIFLIHGKGPQEARKNFRMYRDFIRTTGQITGEDIKIGEEAFAGIHTFYGRVLFARTGSHIIGVVRFNKQNSAADTINLMFSRLKKNG
jgi:hypothetical protein